MNESRTNLFGEPDVPKVAKVVTFADEIKPSAESSWAYLGIVSVPEDLVKTALNRLLMDRESISYPHEIGWSDIKKPGKKRGEKEVLASKWLSRLVQEDDVWRFSVIGLDTEKMLLSHFGDNKGNQLTNAYRRFYRANLKHHVRQLHRAHEGVTVMKAYHDEEGRLQADDWFSWHPHSVIGQEEFVTFNEPEITFVNSCHVKEQKHSKASHFIQLCDLLIGATRYIFEDVGANAARDRVAAKFLPLVERLNCSKRFRNKNSSYNHVGRCSLGFFPKEAASDDQLHQILASGNSAFFRDRPLLHLTRLSGQKDLFASTLNEDSA